MLLVTNRPSVYVLIDGKTEELIVDKPTEVSNFQGRKLIERGICLAVIDAPVEGTGGLVQSHYNPVTVPPVQKTKRKAKK